MLEFLTVIKFNEITIHSIYFAFVRMSVCECALCAYSLNNEQFAYSILLLQSTETEREREGGPERNRVNKIRTDDKSSVL